MGSDLFSITSHCMRLSACLTFLYKDTCTHAHTNMHAHTYTHMHTHPHTHSHTHTHTNSDILWYIVYLRFAKYIVNPQHTYRKLLCSNPATDVAWQSTVSCINAFLVVTRLLTKIPVLICNRPLYVWPAWSFLGHRIMMLLLFTFMYNIPSVKTVISWVGSSKNSFQFNSYPTGMWQWWAL